MSGRVVPIRSSASSPSDASAATTNDWLDSMTARRPERKIGWSSAIRMLFLSIGVRQVYYEFYSGTRSGSRKYIQRGPGHPDPLFDTLKAETLRYGLRVN